MADLTVVMPQLGETVTEGVVGTWLKKVGDKIEKYESIVEVITDKVTAEVPAPEAGVLKEILVQEGETVKVNTAIATMTSDVAAPVGAATSVGVAGNLPLEAAESGPSETLTGAAVHVDSLQSSNGSNNGSSNVAQSLSDDEVKRLYSPAVRRIASEHGVDLRTTTIMGSGGSGRVSKEDILAYIETMPQGQDAAPAAAPAPKPAAPIAQPQPQMESAPHHPEISFPMGSSVTPPMPAMPPTPAAPTPASAATQPQAQAAAPNFGGADEQIVPLTPMRRAIAEHMVRSLATSPHAWTMVEIDMSNVWKLRGSAKEQFKQREGFDLTFFPFFCKAVIEALRQYPQMNSTWRDDQVVLKRAINVAIAVDIADGLITPTIKNADGLSVAGLARSISDLAGRARSNKLKLDDIQGGTITVNNPGAFGSVMSMPIINQPQAAIITMEQIVQRPVIVDGMIAVRHMMYSCLSFDHRIVDGGAAGRFLQSVKKWLEAVNSQTSIY